MFSDRYERERGLVLTSCNHLCNLVEGILEGTVVTMDKDKCLIGGFLGPVVDRDAWSTLGISVIRIDGNVCIA